MEATPGASSASSAASPACARQPAGVGAPAAVPAGTPAAHVLHAHLRPPGDVPAPSSASHATAPACTCQSRCTGGWATRTSAPLCTSGSMLLPSPPSTMPLITQQPRCVVLVLVVLLSCSSNVFFSRSCSSNVDMHREPAASYSLALYISTYTILCCHLNLNFLLVVLSKKTFCQ
jgi:hypothetical protein